MMSAKMDSPQGEFQIFPAGNFRADDGRPKDASAYVLTEKQATALVARFEAKKNPLMVDYEHQAILSKQNGKPAPAAGWVHGLEWRPGIGLFATQVKWTETAREAILADEYRYISPVFTYTTKSGEVESLYNVALVNLPALDGMAAAVAHSLALADEQEEGKATALRQELAEAQAALSALHDLQRTAQEELTALSTRKKQDEIEALVKELTICGQLCPADREAALKLASIDMDAFRQVMRFAGDAISRKAGARPMGGAYLPKAPLGMVCTTPVDEKPFA
jgi:phage I-like protein